MVIGRQMRYEVGVCIATGWIVWFHGPFRCGSWSDEKIVQYGLNQILDWDELYIADGGYKSKGMVLNPDDAVSQEINDYMQICRTRHETINTLFKHFAIIGNRFHRDVSKHGLFTHAVANIVQLGIMFDELSPFDVYDHFQEPDSWQNEWET